MLLVPDILDKECTARIIKSQGLKAKNWGHSWTEAYLQVCVWDRACASWGKQEDLMWGNLVQNIECSERSGLALGGT